jgi:hypothetical protein
MRTDIPEKAGADLKQDSCAADIATQILGSTSGAAISNVLVLGTPGSAPLKRTEIRFDNPEQVPAVLESLALALERSGFEFRTSRNPNMPATEIWLTCPLENRKKMLVTCGVKLYEASAAVETDPSRPIQSNSQPQSIRRWL